MVLGKSMVMCNSKFNAIREGLLTAALVPASNWGYKTGDVIKMYMLDDQSRICPDDYIYIRITWEVTCDEAPNALKDGFMMICFERAMI